MKLNKILLSKKIRSIRKIRNIGVRHVAKEMGISKSTVSRIENNEVVNMDTFYKISNWLGYTPWALLKTITTP